MKDIRQFFKAFMGETAYIVGKGPTHFDYADLQKVDNPILYINESGLLSEKYPRNMKDKTFMFAQDISTHKVIKNSDQYWCVLPNWEDNEKKYDKNYIDQNGECVGDYAIMYERRHNEKKKCGNYIREGLFKKEDKIRKATPKDRDEMEGSTYIPNLVGTIRCAIYFAFYVGISEVLLVGCDGYNKHEWTKLGLWSYDERLRDFVSSKPYGSNAKHKVKAEVMLKNFNIKYSYMGGGF